MKMTHRRFDVAKDIFLFEGNESGERSMTGSLVRRPVFEKQFWFYDFI